MDERTMAWFTGLRHGLLYGYKDQTTAMKTCNSCNTEKPTYQFPVEKSGFYADGLSPTCNICLDERNAHWEQLREEATPIVNAPTNKDSLDNAMAQATVDYNAELEAINKRYQEAKAELDERKATELQRYNETVASVNALYRETKAELEATRKSLFEQFNRELMQASEELRTKRSTIRAELRLL